QAGPDGLSTQEARELRDLVARKFAEMQTTIDRRARGDVVGAVAIVRSNRGKAMMDSIRDITEKAQARETLRLNRALGAADAAARTLRYVILFACVLIVGIGALLIVLVRRAIAELRESRDTTRAVHQRFVEEVGAREQAEEKVRQMQKLEA